MPAALYCNIDGRLHPCKQAPFSSADDHFRLRYGLYETYLCQNGKPEYAGLHWRRLQQGLKLLGFIVPPYFSEDFFTAQIGELLNRNRQEKLARVRIQVFADELGPPFHPRYLIESFFLDQSMTEWLEEGIRIAALAGYQKERSAVSNCKISHNKHFIPARKLMQEQGWDDVLLYNTEGRIAESAIANLFWIREGIVYTPPLTEGCLAGTIRDVLISVLKKHQIPLIELACSLQALRDADEIFLTNGIRKIRWVRELDGRSYENQVTTEIFRLLRENEL